MIEEAEATLRATLADIAATRDANLVTQRAASAAAQTALATAGNEYNDRVQGADEAAAQGLEDYQGFLDQTTTKLTTAQVAIDAIDPTPPSIDATITPITVPTGGTPDCAAADIEGAVNTGFAQVQTVLEAIIDALDTGNIDNAKQALQALKDTGQGMRDQMPPAADNEADKLAKYAELDGLWTF